MTALAQSRVDACQLSGIVAAKEGNSADFWGEERSTTASTHLSFMKTRAEKQPQTARHQKKKKKKTR